MVLSTQELFILIEILGNAHFMTGGTKLGGPHERLEEGLFVELRFGFNQLLVDVLEKAVGAVGEGIMDRLVDGVIGISDGAVNVGDGVTGGAGDARLSGGVIDVIKLRVIESAAEKRHDIVTTSAPARGLHVAVAFEGYLSGFPNAKEVGLVVE